MLQVLYLTAFAIVSFLVIRNLAMNLIALSRSEMQPPSARKRKANLHPELLDEDGNVTDEPLLVIRSTNLEEARERLDALYRGDSDSGDDDLQPSL
ncbi:DUF2973 domain-containing protein [Synechococcus sp. PCC 7336]|uniref:DUF2973 domain-containing protein n=1 Tax=Synechococcus sp. PCC 7336 TaxID=195250 RepID=UPI0003454499|nr:DUF2973 domain-containing protein [Synechococcus sp. PCC 7336]